MQSAIVLDGHQKSALCAVRSLGRQGIAVSLGAERGSAMALHSRYTKERFTYPSPYTDQAGFIEAVKAAAEKIGGRPVAYAFSDATYLTLFLHRAELIDHLNLVFPEADAVEIAFNKAATYSEAKIGGIDVVPTYLPERADELERLLKTLSYPAVIKPRHSVAWQHGRGVFGTASFVQNRVELTKKFSELLTATGEAPIVQPFVAGEEYGVSVLAKDGHIFAEAIHHRLRSLSPTGGASVLKETIDDTELVRLMREAAHQLAAALSWTGPLMVEFKLDNDTHQPLLMELNGRFVGSLPLAVAAGVDFPFLYYQLATGGELPERSIRATPDVVTRYFLGDVKHLLRVLLARDPMRSRLYPMRQKALKDFFRLPPGTKSDTWDARDPLPFFTEFVDAIVRIWK